MKNLNIQPATINTLPSPTNFDAYARAVNDIPMLQEKEEKELALKWLNNKDLISAQKLILSHLRLVVKVVKEHSGYGNNKADLVQEGNIGLMKAVKRFNPLKNVRLGSYALLWIEAEIRSFIINNLRSVKIGSTANLKKLFFGYRKTVNKLMNNGEHDIPLIEERISKELNVPIEDVKVAANYFSGNDIAWEYSNENGDDFTMDNEISKNYWLPAPVSDNPEIKVMENNEENTQLQLLEKAIETLKDREKDILLSRRLMDNPLSLQELATKWNISVERVRQIENAALNKIKQHVLNN